MENYRYLIIGGGMAAAAAVRGIRELDPDGSIGVISAEADPPYKRPPLSKKLWAGKPEQSIWLPLDTQALTLHLACEAQRILPEARRVIDSNATIYGYETLLIATGGTPRRLPWDQGEDLIYFRTYADYRRLRGLANRGERFAVIGGGFIGAEVAAALTMNQKQVVMLFPEQGIGQRIFGPDLSRFLTDYYRQKGVELITEEIPSGVHWQDGKLVLETEQGRSIAVDGIVAGIGLSPNTLLAQEANLHTDNGITVDEQLRTSDPHIYAAGDVANFFSPALGARMRVEHEDNALTMGRCAGRNMAGAQEAYTHLPFFYSDLFDLGYEAVGELDARYEVVADWNEPYHKGVLYYLNQGRIRGILLWNVWGQLESARRLIAEQAQIHAQDLKGIVSAM